MKTLKICKLNLLLACLVTSVSIAQERYKESFNASNDMVVEVNTSHTNVIFETWNKDKVEVEAYVDGEDLTKEEKQQIFDNWDLEVLGNSKKVKVHANSGGLGLGIGSVAGVDALRSLESLKALKGLEKLGDMPVIAQMPDFDFDFNFAVPDIPDFEKFPNWPFTNDRPSIKNKDGYMNYSFNDNGSNTFNQNEYEKDKAKYVAKLNKKYDTNVSVRQVDNWLDEVDAWGEDFGKVMEEWGENFGLQFSEKFGPKWEKKMEKWGDEFGEKFAKDMEKWGEEFGEQFGKDMEKWGEQFGKDMEKWAKNFEKDAEKWAKQFEEGNGSTTIFDDDGSKLIIVDKNNSKSLFNNKANKTIIIRMPKGTKTEVNVRYGELKMANAKNIKANLNYAMLTANSIDGGETLIDASYGPVHVNTWNNGMLKVNYVDDCRLNSVNTIELMANSSDVNINEIANKAILSGSFGNLFVSKIQPNFSSIDVILENTDAALDLPNTSFDFFFVGKKSNLERPSAIQIVDKNGGTKTMMKGFCKSKNSGKTITINADYSNVSFQ